MMIAMRLAALILALAACGDDGMVTEPDAMTGDPLPVEAAPCTVFEQMVSCAESWCDHDEAFIAPLAGTVVVSGDDFVAFEGASTPQSDGTTLILRALEYHFANGAAQAGSYGARGHLPAFDEQCEWAPAIRVE